MYVCARQEFLEGLKEIHICSFMLTCPRGKRKCVSSGADCDKTKMNRYVESPERCSHVFLQGVRKDIDVP